MKKDIMDEELKKIAPLLHNQRKKDDGFSVPEGYFDAFEDQVLGRINEASLSRQTTRKRHKKPAKRISISQFLMAAAAVFALVLSAVWFFKPVDTVDQPLASIELSEDEIEAYLLENVQDFEAEQLAILPDDFENEYQPPLKQTQPNATDTLDDFSPEDVEDILNDMSEEELEEIL